MIKNQVYVVGCIKSWLGRFAYIWFLFLTLDLSWLGMIYSPWDLEYDIFNIVVGVLEGIQIMYSVFNAQGRNTWCPTLTTSKKSHDENITQWMTDQWRLCPRVSEQYCCKSGSELITPWVKPPGDNEIEKRCGPHTSKSSRCHLISLWSPRIFCFLW